jgi:hypothetical protein
MGVDVLIPPRPAGAFFANLATILLTVLCAQSW